MSSVRAVTLRYRRDCLSTPAAAAPMPSGMNAPRETDTHADPADVVWSTDGDTVTGR